MKSLKSILSVKNGIILFIRLKRIGYKAHFYAKQSGKIDFSYLMLIFFHDGYFL